MSLKVDASNRPIMDSEPSTIKLDASNRIWQEPKEEPQPDIDAALSSETKAEDKDAAARKIYIEAQKAQRKADAATKKAKSSLSKADAFDKAVSLAQSGEDPTAILSAAGIDPIKFYRDLTTFALKTPEKTLSPDEQRIKDKEDKLDNYLKELEEKESKLENERFNQAHSLNIKNQVVPILEANPDKYESLLAQYGNNAAIEIYQAVLDRYKLDETVVPFQEAADQIEKYWSDLHEQGINNASKMKKFKDRFKQEGQSSTSHSEQYNTEQSEHTKSLSETSRPSRSQTLTNKQTQQTQPQNPYRNPYKGLRGDEKAAAVLRKLGG